MSAGGVFSNLKLTGNLAAYRDDAYYRDGLGILNSSAAMLYGRKTWETFVKTWPGRDHLWATRPTGPASFSGTYSGQVQSTAQ